VTQQQEHRQSAYRHVLKWTGLFGGLHGLTILMNLVRNKLTVLFLGASGLGIISLYNTALLLVNQFTNFGINVTGVTKIAERTATESRRQIAREVCIVRTWALLAALLGTLVCLVLSPIISRMTFESGDHTDAFILLSPCVGLMSITAGEMAVLTGLKKLKKVALISLLSAAAILLVCTPLYWLLRVNGIALALLLSQIAVTAIHLHFSTKVLPWRVAPCRKRLVRAGIPMVMLGLAYIAAGVFGTGSDYIIRTLIQRFGTLEDLGLYSGSYAMLSSYVAVVFTAITADYFPRLSATRNDIERQNATINQQMEVCVLLITPILIALVLCMPLVLWAIYRSDFMVAAPMTICATFFMFFKAFNLPVAYLALARSDSKTYMAMEFIYDLLAALAIPLSYRQWGLLGAGCALSAAGGINLVMVHVVYHFRYKYIFDRRPLKAYAAQALLLCLSVWMALQPSLPLRIGIGGTAFLLSAALSLRILSRETGLMEALKAKWQRRRGGSNDTNA